jgi:glycosyltransferase involved in cell wall biosynthesis
MRILQIDKFALFDDSAAGGVGQYLRSLEDLLRPRGHEVRRFGCARADEPDRPEFRDFDASARPTDLARMLWNVQAAERLADYLRREPADVSHLHNVYHHLTASILPVLARHKVGVVMTVHDYRQVGREKLFWRWGMGDPPGGRDDAFARAAQRRCAGLTGAALRWRGRIEHMLRWYDRWVDVLLCPTRYMCGVLRSAGLSRRKIVYLPNPVAEQESTSQAEGNGGLLFLGRLAVEKSPDLLLDAARRLPNARIRIVGDGPMAPALRERAQRDGLTGVEQSGHVPAAEVHRLLSDASAVVLTSRCMENSPAVMLEAMAAGRCVIAPDQPAIREWIADGHTGRLYPTGDAEALARVAQEALADAPARRRMGDEARRLVRDRHNPRKLIERIEEVYQTARRRCVLR